MFMNKVIVGVHNGVFHADDVLCVALLKVILNPSSVYVIRTRDKALLSTCDFVLDVGRSDSVSDINVNTKANKHGEVFWVPYKNGMHISFDHHQEETEEGKWFDYYENGVKRAACGKLFEYLWESTFKYELEADLRNDVKASLLEKVFYPVEAQDNGQKFDWLQANKFNFVSTLNPSYDVQNDETSYSRFMIAVNMAEVVFRHMFESIVSAVKASVDMINLLRNNHTPNVLMIGSYLPWEKSVLTWNETLEENDKVKIVIFKASDGENYMVRVVPKGEPNSFESWILLPEEWAGKSNEELDKVTGIGDGVFCHRQVHCRF